MKNVFLIKLISSLILVNLVLTSAVFSQTILTNGATIINDIPVHQRVFNRIGAYGKTSVCSTDTVNYTFNKTSAFQTVTLNATSSGSIFAQWYAAPQAITVYGFDFYAWQTTGTAPITITCNIYNSTTDSLPSGTPLRSITVSVDTTFGGGLLSVLRKKAIFTTPVTTNQAYVLTVETSSSNSVAVVSNNWTATPPNGRAEWLSSVKIGSTFFRGYSVVVGGNRFDADFILQPYVSYSMTAGFTTVNCNSGGNTVYFTNTSSPVLFNKFYSTRAFFNIPQYSCLWDFGDSTGSWYYKDGMHNYSYRIAYNVTLKDSLYGWLTGCGDQATNLIPVGPPAPGAYNNSPLCAGTTIHLRADTITGATYYWTGPNGFSSALQNPNIANANISMVGNYNVRAIIGQCSSMVATTYVNVISTPTASNNGPLCAGQTLNLSASSISGATYSWTGPNSFTSSLSNPVKTGTTVADSGTYSVSITLAGCGTIGPFTTLAIVNRVPGIPTVSSNSPLCVGDNLNLTSSGYAGGSYSWIGPNAFTSTQQNPSRSTVLSSYAGTYNVTITSNGCTSPAGSTTVTINNVPSTPTAGNNGPLCSGQSLSLTATAIAGATYAWSGPNSFTSTSQNPTRSSITTSDAGWYSIIATVSGCSSYAGTTYVAITTLTPTPVTSSNGPLCPGQNLQLAASTIPGATYSWTGPNSFTSTQQNPTISSVTAVNAGIYSVTATTSGCGTSSAGNTTLAINSLPGAPTAGNNSPVCNGDSIRLTASNITGANYFWSGPNGFSSGSQNPLIANASSIKAGIYSVYVTVTGCGTSPTSTTNVITHAIPPTPTALSNSPVCTGDSISFSASITGVGPNVNYTWSGPNNFNSSLANPVLHNSNSAYSGTYNLTVTDSGCTSQTGSTYVTVKSIPSTPTPSSNAPICQGGNLFLSASTVPGAFYSWTGPKAFKSLLQNPFISNATDTGNTGTYTVTAIVNGCISIPASLLVIINPLPATPVASNSSPKCIGDNVSLFASTVSGATYSWTGPNGYSSTFQNPVLTNVSTAVAGIYSVVAITSTCTSNSASTAVIVNSVPLAPILSSNAVSGLACTGDTLMLFANFVSGATYTWNGPAGFGDSVQNPIIPNLKTINGGTYSASISKGGCSSSASTINITVNQSPATGPITGKISVKNYEVDTYSVTGSLGSVYNWLITGGGTLQSGGSTNTIIVKWGAATASAFLRVRETAITGCNGPLQQLNISVSSTVGMKEEKMNSGFVTVYPNPANRVLNISFDLQNSAEAKMEMLNLVGQTVLSYTKEISKSENVELDISNLRSGIYLTRVTIGDEKKIFKVVVE
ncbi:MAG: T9SS type A sorting domain-containing protein [Bacteroidia bacterium]